MHILSQEQRELLAQERARKETEQRAERLALEQEARELAALRRHTEEEKRRLREDAIALQAARNAHATALADNMRRKRVCGCTMGVLTVRTPLPL